MTDSESEEPIRVPDYPEITPVESAERTSLSPLLEDFNTVSPIIPPEDNQDETSRESDITAITRSIHDQGSNHLPETPNCATKRHRRAIYKRSESKNERRDRKERLLNAVKSRMKKLDQVKSDRCQLTATFDQKVENVLTRDLLLLSGDRHGPFVGRPRYVKSHFLALALTLRPFV